MSTAAHVFLKQQAWGSYTVMRALLSHLYSKPVAIQSCDLQANDDRVVKLNAKLYPEKQNY